MNSLSLPLKQKLIKSPITDFSLWCGIFVYKVEGSNVEIEIIGKSWLIFEIYAQ